MIFAFILQHASKYFEKLHQDEKFARKISQPTRDIGLSFSTNIRYFAVDFFSEPRKIFY
jgi:hypothetical protein